MLMCDYVPAAWLRVAVWICLGSRRTSTVKNTRRGTHAALFPWACITSEECLQREFCVLTELYEIAWFTHKPPLIYTQSLCFHR